MDEGSDLQASCRRPHERTVAPGYITPITHLRSDETLQKMKYTGVLSHPAPLPSSHASEGTIDGLSSIRQRLPKKYDFTPHNVYADVQESSTITGEEIAGAREDYWKKKALAAKDGSQEDEEQKAEAEAERRASVDVPPKGGRVLDVGEHEDDDHVRCEEKMVTRWAS